MLLYRPAYKQAIASESLLHQHPDSFVALDLLLGMPHTYSSKHHYIDILYTRHTHYISTITM